MRSIIINGYKPVDSPVSEGGKRRWSFMEKLFLGLTPREYLRQAVKNPINWILGAIFAVGLPLVLYRFIFGLGSVTHSSNDYPGDCSSGSDSS